MGAETRPKEKAMTQTNIEQTVAELQAQLEGTGFVRYENGKFYCGNESEWCGFCTEPDRSHIAFSHETAEGQAWFCERLKMTVGPTRIDGELSGSWCAKLNDYDPPLNAWHMDESRSEAIRLAIEAAARAAQENT